MILKQASEQSLSNMTRNHKIILNDISLPTEIMMICVSLSVRAQNNGKDKDLLRESYEEFCGVRRKLIAHGFADWLREETLSWHLDRRIRPDKRMFTDSPFEDDLIRNLIIRPNWRMFS